MPVWYLLLALICYSVFCCEAHNKGSALKQHEVSLLKFFKLNEENRNETLNILNKNETLHPSGKCGHLVKKLCARKYKSKSNTVKKSFRPYDYDDDDDDDEEDYDDYDETPDDEEFPEETERGSYRSFDTIPPSAIRDHEDHESDYDREPWHGHDFEDEDPREHDRPGYEGDMDDWDWDSPRRHHGRHAFARTGRERWRSHNLPQEDDYEPDYSSQYRHHPRHAHYHHHHYYRPQVQASYRTFSQASPSWSPYPQGYPRGSPYPSPAQYISNPLSTMTWTNPATYQPRWPLQSGYYSPQTVALNSLNTQLVGSSRLNPYQQKTFSYPRQEPNSFFIPPYHVSSPSYLQASTRNLAEFGAPPHPGLAATGAATLPRLSQHIYHYPRVVSRPRHLTGPLRRLFLRHQEFPEAVLNSLRDLNLH